MGVRDEQAPTSSAVGVLICGFFSTLALTSGAFSCIFRTPEAASLVRIIIGTLSACFRISWASIAPACVPLPLPAGAKRAPLAFGALASWPLGAAAPAAAPAASS